MRIATGLDLPIPRISYTPKQLMEEIENASGLIIKKNIRLKRVVAMKALFSIKMEEEHPTMTLEEVGDMIGRDHATILYYRNSYKKIDYYYYIKEKLKW